MATQLHVVWMKLIATEVVCTRCHSDNSAWTCFALHIDGMGLDCQMLCIATTRIVTQMRDVVLLRRRCTMNRFVGDLMHQQTLLADRNPFLDTFLGVGHMQLHLTIVAAHTGGCFNTTCICICLQLLRAFKVIHCRLGELWRDILNATRHDYKWLPNYRNSNRVNTNMKMNTNHVFIKLSRQNRYEPPPEFPLASPYSGIVHHLSGPNMYALLQTQNKDKSSVPARLS